MTDRTRTYSWEDTSTGLEAQKSLSGLEFLQQLLAGALPAPPIAKTLDFTITEVSRGRARFSVQPEEFHYNPIGMVHGGLAATLLDTAMGCAVHSVLEKGVGYTTVDLHVTYVKALRHTARGVHCIGNVVHEGGRIVTASGELRDGDNVLYAHAITTCLLLRPERR